MPHIVEVVAVSAPDGHCRLLSGDRDRGGRLSGGRSVCTPHMGVAVAVRAPSA